MHLVEKSHLPEVQLEGGRGGGRAPQNLADQLNLFEPGWADFAPHTTASPPDSKSYLHLCSVL